MTVNTSPPTFGLDWSLWQGERHPRQSVQCICGLYTLDACSTFVVTTQTPPRNCSMSPEGQKELPWVSGIDQEAGVRGHQGKKPVVGTVYNRV